MDGYAGPRCEECLETGHFFNQLTNRCHECPSPVRVTLIFCCCLAALAAVVAVVVQLGRAEPEQLPFTLRGIAGVAGRFLDRSASAAVRLALQEKFKIVVSFFRTAPADQTRDITKHKPALLPSTELAFPRSTRRGLGSPSFGLRGSSFVRVHLVAAFLQLRLS